MSDSQQLPLFITKNRTSLSRQTPLVNAIEPFQTYLRDEGKTLNTIKGFTSDLQLMCQYFGGKKRIESFTTQDLNRFLDWLEHGRGQPCSRKSYARRVTTIKVFFKWLEKEKIRLDNPAVSILQRSGPAPLQTVLSNDEINALLDFTHNLRFAKKPDPRPNLLVRLLLDTGIKKSECMSLTPLHIQVHDPQAPLLSVQYKSRRNIYKERLIPLDPNWLEVLDEYMVQYRVEGLLFDCTARNLEYVLHDTAIGAGVEGRVSFEILRWTCMVRDYLKGMDMDELREKMGLSRISWRETSQKVIQLAQRELARH